MPSASDPRSAKFRATVTGRRLLRAAPPRRAGSRAVDSLLCDAPRSGRKPRGVRDRNDSPPPSPATHPATATRGSLPDPRPPHHDLILPATGPRHRNPGLGSKHRQRPTAPRASVPYAAPTVPPERPHSSPAVASSPAPSGSPRTARPPQALPAGPGRGEADSALQAGARHAADLPRLPGRKETGGGTSSRLPTSSEHQPLRGHCAAPTPPGPSGHSELWWVLNEP